MLVSLGESPKFWKKGLFAMRTTTRKCSKGKPEPEAESLIEFHENCRQKFCNVCWQLIPQTSYPIWKLSQRQFFSVKRICCLTLQTNLRVWSICKYSEDSVNCTVSIKGTVLKFSHMMSLLSVLFGKFSLWLYLEYCTMAKSKTL